MILLRTQHDDILVVQSDQSFPKAKVLVTTLCSTRSTSTASRSLDSVEEDDLTINTKDFVVLILWGKADFNTKHIPHVRLPGK